jgi:predicted MFS family arabinose efflux permease
MTAQNELKRSTLLVMAGSSAITVANLYYNQPLLEQIRLSFGVSYDAIGWVPTLTQIGYAFGMLLVVPLGDMMERRRLVLLFTALSALCCLLLATAQAFPLLIVGSFLLGLTTMTPQLLIPFAALLAAPEKKGKVVGTMVSGLLLGILLARTVAGFVGSAYGWRAMFGIAAGILTILIFILAALLPKSNPSYHGKYSGLLASVVNIFRQQPVLREAALYGAMLFGSFSAFWVTLIHLLETPAFNLGARSVGLYGLLGAAAAGASPLIGALSDKGDPRRTTGIMIVLTLFSFLVFGLSAESLIGLGIGVLLMDIGVQGGHISNQTRIFALIPEAQSRIQTAYMFFYFAGGALGSLVGTWAWSRWNWVGVCGAAACLLLVALARFVFFPPKTAA